MVEDLSFRLFDCAARLANSRPTSSLIRAARALLGWSQTKLARSAGIGLATLQRIEQSDGILKGNSATVLKIQRVLEGAGISFTDDAAGEIGVRLLKTKSRENTL